MKKHSISREAFLNKYKARTFEPIMEGTRIVLSEINKYLDIEESGSFTHPMYSREEVSAIMETVNSNDMARAAFNRFNNLSNWLCQTRAHTVLLLKISYALLMQIDEMVNTMLKTEVLELALREKDAEAISPESKQLLDSMNLLRFTYFEHDEINFYAMRDSISDGIMYAKAFEKAVEMIAKEINVPETMIFVTDDLKKTEALLSAIRENLGRLQQFVDEHDFESEDMKKIRQGTLTILSAPMASDDALSKKGITKARKMIRGLDAFDRSTNGIIQTLMVKEFSTDK